MSDLRPIRTLSQVSIVLLVLWVGSGLAGAHAVVVESSPKDKEVLTIPPKFVVLRFNARIEKSLTSISLKSGDGRSIPLFGVMENDSHDAPDRLVIRLPNLGPGSYLLRYKVLSTDGHATSGMLRFSIVGSQ